MNTATLQFIAWFKDENPLKLALKSDKFPDVDMRFALRQIAGRQSIKEKLPTWYASEGILYPEHLPLEQCSSEATARYKAQLVQGNSLIDLTGGLGVDCYFLSRNFVQTTYVERQADLCAIAKENFKVLDASIAVCCDDAVHFLETNCPQSDVIFIDPARRDCGGSKVVSLADCEPNLVELLPLLFTAAPIVLAKLSPMLDVSATIANLQYVKELHCVSVDNECKELLVLMERGFKGEPRIKCTNITKKGIEQFDFLLSEEKTAEPNMTDEVGRYLYEPNASILKAGAFKLLTYAYDVCKLHINSHLYTSNKWISTFSGRQFEIVRQFEFGKREIEELRQAVSGKCNLTVRNFPVSVDALRKKLRLKEGGDAYVFATTIGARKVLLLCRKVKVEE